MSGNNIFLKLEIEFSIFKMLVFAIIKTSKKHLICMAKFSVFKPMSGLKIV